MKISLMLRQLYFYKMVAMKCIREDASLSDTQKLRRLNLTYNSSWYTRGTRKQIVRERRRLAATNP